MVDEARNLDRATIEDYCRKYPLFTTDITFKFHITDNSTPPAPEPEEEEEAEPTNVKIGKALMTALSSPAPRATINIEYKALHAISTEAWHKQNSIRAYMPEEFKARFVNMDSKEADQTTVYDLLATYREGSNLAKKDEHRISIAELCALPDKERDKKIELYYRQLWKALVPPDRLALPYTNNKEKRKSILMARLSRLYGDALDKDTTRASYKSIHATCNDDKRRISFPYFFEILAVPFANPIAAEHGVTFVGAVNYSISPKVKSNWYDGGNYDDYFENTSPFDLDNLDKAFNFDTEPITNIRDVLEQYNFHSYAVDTAKIPCVVVANLVTPRRDPHGYDKSSIDVNPFTFTIVQAVKRLADDIKSYQARNIRFRKPQDRSTAIEHRSGRGLLEKMLTDYLIEHHGLRTKGKEPTK